MEICGRAGGFVKTLTAHTYVEDDDVGKVIWFSTVCLHRMHDILSLILCSKCKPAMLMHDYNISNSEWKVGESNIQHYSWLWT